MTGIFDKLFCDRCGSIYATGAGHACPPLRGTPQQLGLAIEDGLQELFFPIGGLPDGVQVIRRHVRDFLAQHITVAQFEIEMPGADKQQVLSALFERVTR